MADISIGRQIAALRKKSKITQEELADVLKYAKYMDKCAIDCFQNAKAAYESAISADENSIQSDQARTCLVRLRCRNGEGERCIKEQKKRLSSEPDNWRAY